MTITNKYLKGLALIAVALISFNSCKQDNIMELEPFSSISENEAFNTEANIDLALNGMYQAAQMGLYNGSSRGYPFGAAYFEQNDMRGEDMVSTATFYSLTYMSNWDPSGSLNNVYYWIDTYRLINRTNLVIDGVKTAIQKGVISTAKGNDYIGQALFLRAFAHYELLNFFARPYSDNPTTNLGIPYRLLPNNTVAAIDANSQLPRGTVQDNFTQLITDLNDAENFMVSKTTKNTKDGITYASKEAAIALKTRVYLSMGNLPAVIAEADKLNGLYTLTSDPNAPFANNYGNSESIFSIENSATNNPNVNGALASMYNGRHLIAISPVLWDNPGWLAADKRRGASMVATVSGALYTLKYKDTSTLSDASPLLRYAEVLLNRAEAKARLHDPTYLADLNVVRNRSLINPGTDQYASFGSDADAVKAILLERRIEFLGEGLRWNTIQRLQQDPIAPINGIPAKYRNAIPAAADYHIGTAYTFKPNDLPAIPYSDHRYVWPIPTLETSANPVLAAQQNPGY